MNVHATVTTDNDDVVAVRATGTATLGDDGIAKGTLALRFQTASESLAWLKREVGIARTKADMVNGTLELASYTIAD